MAEKKSSNKLPRTNRAAIKERKAAAQKRARENMTDEALLSTRTIYGLIALVLFIMHVLVAIYPDGILIQWLGHLLKGTVGKAGFYLSIPALFCIFWLLMFQKNRKVLTRCVALVAFPLTVSCIFQLMMKTDELGTGFSIVKNLYLFGIAGQSSGILCGGIAMLVDYLLGVVLSCILFFLASATALLAIVDVTIPKLIQSFRKLPVKQREEKEYDEYGMSDRMVGGLYSKWQESVDKRNLKNEQFAAEVERQQQEMPASKPSKFQKCKTLANAFMRVLDEDVDGPVGYDDDEYEEVYTAAPQQPVEPEEPEAPVEAPKAAPVSPAAAAVMAEKKVSARDAAESAVQVAAEIAQAEEVEKPEYCYPPLELLHLPAGNAGNGTEEMRENSRRLNETLASFKIEAHIINVTRGPSVTRYEVELDRGVRLNKLTTSADDIALNLGASGVRIAAIPGKISVVGIEVPNKAVTTVSLREVIDSQEFKKARSKSSFAVGKDISGNCIVGNISKLPHMLIAGTTGSGKSVCMNSIIISLLYKAGPEDVKLIMVDPKMVELGIYNGIPHLLIPVVTDPKKAAGSLQWAVTEMMRRYRSMSDAGVRDLESYNAIVDSQEEEGKHLPQIVVIIDELADLMLVAAKEVEESICRIAQMGRAAGIHLIIATQRPSADVITGLMKANIPSRIAFAVASSMESRIILDTQGAEKLVGKGDMLYAPIGCGKPKRVQGSWVSEEEVEAVTGYIKEHYQTEYDEEVENEINQKAEQTGNKSASGEPQANADELEGDEMLPAAVEVILETGQASVSMLQRRLKLGYARAARIVDEMEEKGIVGPFMGSKPRNILITKEQWLAMSGAAPDGVLQDLPQDLEEAPPFNLEDNTTE